MNLDKIYTDAEFANAVIPVGTRLMFLGYKDGISGEVTLRYKDSNGNFGNVSTAGGEIAVATAENTTVADAGNNFSSNNVEGCLAELAESMDTLSDDFSSVLGEIATSLAEI